MLSAAMFLAASMMLGQADGANVPDEFVRQCKYYLGEWASEVEVDGKVYRGTLTVTWSQDKACVLVLWAAETPTGRGSGTRVQGWDASTKEVLVVDFGKDGGSSIERYKIISDRIDEGKISRVDAEGSLHKATAHTDRMDQDHFTWTVTEDGRPTAYKFHRVKK